MGYQKLTPIIATGSTEPRYLSDRFADIVSVKDFGAKGDGTTDDTAAFRAAALSNGVVDTQATNPTLITVFVPDGTYKLISDPVPELSEENDAYGVIVSTKFNLCWILGRNVVLTGSGKLHGTIKRDYPCSKNFNWFTKWQMEEGGRTHSGPNNAKIEILSEEGEFLDTTNITSAVQTKYSSANIQRDHTAIFASAVHNHATKFHRVWGLYAEAINNNNGSALAAEIDPVNTGSYYSVNPFSQHGKQSIGIQIAAGAEYPGLTHADCSAAIQIAGASNTPTNGVAKFGVGINIMTDAIRGVYYDQQDGKWKGTGIAIAMGRGHAMAWYCASNQISNKIISYADTVNGGSSFEFHDDFDRLVQTSNGDIAFQINRGSNLNKNLVIDLEHNQHGVFFLAGSTSLADVDLLLFPKGNGYIGLGVTQTTGTFTCDRYIKIKDKDGNILKIPCTVE